MDQAIVTEIDRVEAILGAHRPLMGEGFAPYRNHVYRVLNFCLRLHEVSAEELERLAVAAAFHDLGMWPGEEIDYLAPSIRLAREYLAREGHEAWAEEVAMMIEYHHRFRRCPPEFPRLVEVLRQGDWVDATKGWRRFRLSRADVREVQAALPNLGFHENLVRIALREFPRRPGNPLPMMKW